jgi:hypothetical protein
LYLLVSVVNGHLALDAAHKNKELNWMELNNFVGFLHLLQMNEAGTA